MKKSASKSGEDTQTNHAVSNMKTMENKHRFHNLETRIFGIKPYIRKHSKKSLADLPAELKAEIKRELDAITEELLAIAGDQGTLPKKKGAAK